MTRKYTSFTTTHTVKMDIYCHSKEKIMLTIRPFKQVLNDSPSVLEQDFIARSLYYLELSYSYNYVKDVKRYYIFKRLYDEKKDVGGFIHILRDGMTWLELCELVYTIGYFPVYHDLSGMIHMNEIYMYDKNYQDKSGIVWKLYVRGSSGKSWVVERLLTEKDSKTFVEIMDMLMEAKKVRNNE
jgi:hypothetical protein